jgi:branched-subunit amino acid transport protein AzlD
VIGSVGDANVHSTPGTTVPALIAVAATVVVHLILGRRTLLSVRIGTAIYVTPMNMS